MREVSFAVAPGECVGLLGTSGSGKSTLLLHLNGILRRSQWRRARCGSHGLPVTAGDVNAVRRRVELLDNEEPMLAHGLERPRILQHRHPHGGYAMKLWLEDGRGGGRVGGEGAAERFRQIE